MRRLFRPAVLVAAGGMAACGGASRTPAAPSPSAPVAPTSWSLTGTIVSTLARRPVPGAIVDALGTSATTGTDGRFTLTRTIAPLAPFAAVVHADGYRIRKTTITYPRSADAVIDLTASTPPFNEVFYDEFARGTLEYPGHVYPLFRWTAAPHIYFKTTDENGRAAPPEVITLVSRALAQGVRLFSNGQFGATIETGTKRRAEQDGWINVELRRTIEEGDYCGLASSVGGNPNTVQLRLERCGCGSVKISASVVMHEIGHVLGFFHVPDPNSIMFATDSGDCRVETLSPMEATHVAVAYSRPRGNLDPDTDPLGFGLFQPPPAGAHAPGPVS